MKVLVTGGLGYIGSHTVVELLENNYDVVVVDNLYNSKIEMKEKIEDITKKTFSFYQEDVCREETLDSIFEQEKPDAVIHFAALKAVGESVKKPIEYYQNNLTSTLSLCKVMKKHSCEKIVFSSSATVYGKPKSLPIQEDFPLSATNPYGYTKLMNEQILKDIAKADPNLRVMILRYFNPIGAHISGLIGEEPNGIPNNLMPYIVRVAIGKLKELSIFGDDYDTLDGTGVRDYIHVVDLAKGHIKALEKMNQEQGVHIYNLGTGQGYSVLEMVQSFEKTNGVKIPYKIVERREGDIDSCYADPTKALQELNWKAEKGLEDMMKDSYRYIQTQKKKS